jgi:curved DNA-binding protein CbpA
MFRIQIDTDSHYAVLGVPPDATPEQITQARDRGVHALRLRQRNEPVNRDELIEMQKALNAAGETLARPARRREYDAANPHLRYFTVRTGAAPMFVNAADLVVALHAAIARHLDEAGAPPPIASDLERLDFTADLTWNALLDD